MKKIESYKKLSLVYENGWGEFSAWTVEFTQRLLKKHHLANINILDLACGTGTYCINMAQKNHNVVGLDKSKEMINLASKKTKELANCNFINADMSDFGLECNFDLCTCWFDSINYLLNIEDVRSMIENVFDCLISGGLFIFDSNTHNHYLKNHNNSFDRQFGDITIHHNCKYDKELRLAHTEFIFPNKTIEKHVQRPYDLNDFRPLLIRTGFKILETYSNFKEKPYTKDSDRLICVTQKH